MYTLTAILLAGAGGCVAGVILHATITAKIHTLVATIKTDIANLAAKVK